MNEQWKQKCVYVEKNGEREREICPFEHERERKRGF